MTEIKPQKPLSFDGLGIDSKILDIIRNLNFTTPTPIQFKSIPVVISGKDMVGIAQTGTGKTLAFGIPVLQRLVKYKGRCLILVPTRELASQVDDHLKIIATKLNLKTVVLIGGESKHPQIRNLQRRPEIIVATPGRLIDHLESRNLNLNEVKTLILDEADLMFDMGFAPQLNTILKLAPKEKQTILFSATMPAGIMNIATKHMKLPLRIEVAPAGTPAENVIQEVIVLHKEDRTVQLAKILAQYQGSVLIFVRTKSSVKNIIRSILDLKHTVAEIHSNRTLVQRTRALSGFKEGKYRILVATDIAARGIDVKGIELVLNYDLPDNIEDYIHRIGRTGRAGKMGQAISFAAPSQIGIIRRIERIIKKEIPLTKLVAIKNDGQGLGQDSRYSGFQATRGYRKNTSRSGSKYQGKSWFDRKPSSTRAGGYKKFESTPYKSKIGADKLVISGPNKFNRYDKFNQARPAGDQSKTWSDRQPSPGYQSDRQRFDQSKPKSNNFSRNRKNKSNDSSKNRDNKPYAKRGQSRVKPKKRY